MYKLAAGAGAISVAVIMVLYVLPKAKEPTEWALVAILFMLVSIFNLLAAILERMDKYGNH
jgi:hypothetical protein